jgi:putative protease
VATGRVELAFGHDALDCGALQPGQAVWKTDDPQLTSRLRKTFTGEGTPRRQPVDLHVTAGVGATVRVTARTATGHGCTVVSTEPAREATKHPLDEGTLREQLGRLGGTAFALGELTADIQGRPMLPFSVLGRLRHDLVAALDAAVVVPPPRNRGALHASRRREPADSGPQGDERRLDPASAREAPVLHVLVRALAQLRCVLEFGETDLVADFADIRQYREAVAACRAAGATLLLATPRIQKPDEMGIFQLLARQEPDGILVRNWAGLRFFRDRGMPVRGDFSLNVTNGRTAEFFMQAGCTRVTASYDCNREQLLGLLAATPPDWLEIVIHQHMPMFHMEHCVFCAVLSPGTNKTNCGRPCDEHVVHLRDRIGIEHPLTADVGCRNTLWSAVPQSAAEVVPTLLGRGVRHFRLELLDEPAAEIGRIVAAYRDLLAGRAAGRDVWRALNAANRVGVTRGTLEERRNPLAIL